MYADPSLLLEGKKKQIQKKKKIYKIVFFLYVLQVCNFHIYWEWIFALFVRLEYIACVYNLLLLLMQFAFIK